MFVHSNGESAIGKTDINPVAKIQFQLAVNLKSNNYSELITFSHLMYK